VYFQDIGYFGPVRPYQPGFEPGRLGFLWNGENPVWTHGGAEAETNDSGRPIGTNPKVIQNLTDTLFRTSFRCDAGAFSVPTVDEIMTYAMVDSTPEAIADGVAIIQEFYMGLEEPQQHIIELLAQGGWEMTEVGERIQMAATIVLQIATGPPVPARGLKWDEDHYTRIREMQLYVTVAVTSLRPGHRAFVFQ